MDNIRQKAITVTLPLASVVDSGNGCVDQPVVYLCDRSRGFLPRDVVVDRKPEASNAVSPSQANTIASGSKEVVLGETGSPPL